MRVIRSGDSVVEWEQHVEGPRPTFAVTSALEVR